MILAADTRRSRTISAESTAFGLTLVGGATLPSFAMTNLFTGATISSFWFLLAAIILPLSWRRTLPYRHLFSAWEWGLFLLWAGLSFLWTYEPGTYVRYLITYASCAASVWVLASITPTPRRAALVLASVASGIGIALLFHFFGNTVVQGRRTVLNLNSNYLAYSYAMAAPALLYGIRRVLPTMPGRGLAIGVMACLTAGVLAAGTRGALLAIFPSILLLLPELTRKSLIRFTIFLGISILLAAGFLTAIYPTLTPDTQVRLSQLAFWTEEAQKAGLNTSGRAELWPIALAILQGNLLFGLGMGGAESFLSEGIRPHNVFLSIGMDLGVPGAFLIGLCAFRRTWPNKLYGKLGALEKQTLYVMSFCWLVIAMTGVWEAAITGWFLLGALTMLIRGLRPEAMARANTAEAPAAP
jgi:hypothetical protein